MHKKTASGIVKVSNLNNHKSGESDPEAERYSHGAERYSIMAKDSKKQVVVQPSARIQIKDRQKVDCIIQGDRHLEVVYMAKRPRPGVLKLSKEEYLILSTGEIKKYEYSDKRYTWNLGRTFRELRYLIRTNFAAEGSNQLMITLTYGENMQDSERLMVDFDAFMKRLKRKLKGHKLDYITVAEPQARGAWHMHLMLKSDQPVLYVDNREMERIWRHGMTKTERLKSDDVGAYYVSYFTDLTIEAKEQSDKPNKEMSKARKKGQRLHFYPKNFKFYRCSQGITRPTKEQREYWQVQAEFGEPVHTTTHDVMIENELDQVEQEEGKVAFKLMNVIQRESYKKPGDFVYPEGEAVLFPDD